MLETDELEQRRPLGLTLLTGLYLFFFLVSVSTYGNPFPLLGTIYQGRPAQVMVFLDCLVCLYLFLGLTKRQLVTWYLLLCYNLFEIVNTLVNLYLITPAELEKILGPGSQIQHESLLLNNIVAALGILLLTQFIYRNKSYFTNRQLYLI
jgi:hypothetical protein